MAKLTRKLWVGIGAATLASAPAVGAAMAQDEHDEQPQGPSLALVVRGPDRLGLLHALSGVISAHHGNISSVEIVERGERSAIFFERSAPVMDSNPG